MTLTEEQFHDFADEALEDLDQSFSRLSTRGDVECDLEGNVLRITFEEPERAVFVVSPNAPARQIWVSARLKSFKFDWLPSEQRFGLHGTGEPLSSVLQRLTREQLGDEALKL
jgi:CyaY protein